jgi:cardiolipin synthase
MLLRVRVLTAPNVVTFGRLLAVPLFAGLHLTQHPLAALWVFVGAGLSDGIDGLLARLLDQRSPLGALLDPIADKLLIATALIALTWTGDLPRWFVLLALLREGVLLLGALAVWARGRAIPRRPVRLGKYATFLQLAVASLGLCARIPGWGPHLEALLLCAVFLAAECSLLSAAQYAVQVSGLLRARTAVDEAPPAH